jgi:hypothetical protein
LRDVALAANFLKIFTSIDVALEAIFLNVSISVILL